MSDDQFRDPPKADRARAIRLAENIIARHTKDPNRFKWHDIDVTLAREVLRKAEL